MESGQNHQLTVLWTMHTIPVTKMEEVHKINWHEWGGAWIYMRGGAEQKSGQRKKNSGMCAENMSAQKMPDKMSGIACHRCMTQRGGVEMQMQGDQP